jgi:hypothetical protein
MNSVSQKQKNILEITLLDAHYIINISEKKYLKTMNSNDIGKP